MIVNRKVNAGKHYFINQPVNRPLAGPPSFIIRFTDAACYCVHAGRGPRGTGPSDDRPTSSSSEGTWPNWITHISVALLMYCFTSNWINGMFYNIQLSHTTRCRTLNFFSSSSSNLFYLFSLLSVQHDCSHHQPKHQQAKGYHHHTTYARPPLPRNILQNSCEMGKMVPLWDCCAHLSLLTCASSSVSSRFRANFFSANKQVSGSVVGRSFCYLLKKKKKNVLCPTRLPTVS